VAQNEAKHPRGRPFAKGQSGNPAGKPLGARHKATLAAEALFDGEAASLTRKAIELALAGDPAMLRLCLERILPPRRERPVRFDFPPFKSAGDAAAAMAAVTVAVANGEITPGEAAEIAKLVDVFVRVSELAELDRRLRAVEASAGHDAAEVERLSTELQWRNRGSAASPVNDDDERVS
jgi:hypothetical protein